jgi:outer membrane beta-barrel protein
MLRSTSIALALALALGAGRARAAEPVIYGPDGAPTVVQNKLYTMTSRWELALGGTLAVNGSLVDHYGGLLGFTYHPNEWFDMGVELAGNYTGLTSLASQVRDKLPARADPTTHTGLKGDEIANSAQMRAAGMVIARLAPFYGKFNLASELSVHFQAYALLGGGAGMFHHESVNICGQAGQGACAAGQYLTSDATRFAGQIGAGFRFYLGNNWSLRTELRAVLFKDSYIEGADLTQPNSGTDHAYIGVITLFTAGVSVLF